MTDKPTQTAGERYSEAASLISTAAQTIKGLERELEAARMSHEMQQRNTESCHREANQLREVLRHIVECHDARSELYTSEEDCAATLADHARKALS
jgi:hypothetical protein